MPRGRRLYRMALATVVVAVAAVLIARAGASPHRFEAVHAPPRLLDTTAATQSKWLPAAETAYDRTRAWGGPRRGWYRKFLPGQVNNHLVTLWHVVHLFGATSAIAIADPTPAHVAAARSFA